MTSDQYGCHDVSLFSVENVLKLIGKSMASCIFLRHVAFDICFTVRLSSRRNKSVLKGYYRFQTLSLFKKIVWLQNWFLES